MVLPSKEFTKNDFSGRDAAEACISLEGLPCLAFLDYGDEIAAANELAREFVGTSARLQPRELFLRGYPASGDGSRRRFECSVLSPGGEPIIAWGAVQRYSPAGGDARLILLMEAEPAAGMQPEGGYETAQIFLEDLFDSSPVAMVIVQGRRIVRANQEFVRMFGYPMEVCLGDTLFDLIIPPSRYHESEILQHDVELSGRASMETVRRTATGEEKDVSITVVEVRLSREATGLAVSYRDIREQKRAEARLQHASLHDSLTGLANRVLFLDRLTSTLARLERRPDRRFAVVFLDVDRFKQVNDSLGHAAGDELLLAVTKRLQQCLRPQDTIARFGGDEFALLLDDVSGLEEVAGVATRIQNEIKRPVEIGGSEVFVSASMGIALGLSEYSSPDQIMRDADAAMYRAKANGRGRHEFFEALKVALGGFA